MLKVTLAMIAGGLMLSAPAIASYSSSLDDDGCWDGRDSFNASCMTATSRWDGDAFISTFTNNCGQRIYARFCNQRESGGYHDCGASGIAGYSSHNWRTGTRATGRYQARQIGSVNPSYDWVCADRVNGWHNDMF